MTVLLFGFEPFSEYSENPSEIIVRNLNGNVIEGHKIIGVILPVVYDKLEEMVTQSIRRYQPNLILGIGLAPGRTKITPEKIAINYKYSRIPDNMGVTYKGQRIDMNEPDGIFSNLPVEELVEYLKSKNIPSEISLSAGSYICNMTMFLVLREAKGIGARGGFIHIPCHEKCAIESKRDMAFMSLDKMQEAINLAIQFYLKN